MIMMIFFSKVPHSGSDKINKGIFVSTACVLRAFHAYCRKLELWMSLELLLPSDKSQVSKSHRGIETLLNISTLYFVVCLYLYLLKVSSLVTSLVWTEKGGWGEAGVLGEGRGRVINWGTTVSEAPKWSSNESHLSINWLNRVKLVCTFLFCFVCLHVWTVIEHTYISTYLHQCPHSQDLNLIVVPTKIDTQHTHTQ